jgi:hypothetical protein
VVMAVRLSFAMAVRIQYEFGRGAGVTLNSGGTRRVRGRYTVPK